MPRVLQRAASASIVLVCALSCISPTFTDNFGLLWTKPGLLGSGTNKEATKSVKTEDITSLLNCWFSNSCDSFAGLSMQKLDNKPDFFLFLHADVSATEFSYHANAFSAKKDGGTVKFLKRSMTEESSVSWVSADQNMAFARHLVEICSSSPETQIYADTNVTYISHSVDNFIKFKDVDEITKVPSKKLHLVLLPNRGYKNTDSGSALKEADELIQSMLEDLKSPFIASYLSYQAKEYKVTLENDEEESFLDYFTPEVVVVLIFAIVLLLILYTGLSCLLALQTPPRFHISREQLDAKNK